MHVCVCAPVCALFQYLSLSTPPPALLSRCPDPAQVKEIQVAAKNIEEVSIQLAECASELMKMEEEDESPEARQATEEKKELLCRDWATQVGINRRNVFCHYGFPYTSCMQIQMNLSMLHVQFTCTS